MLKLLFTRQNKNIGKTSPSQLSSHDEELAYRLGPNLSKKFSTLDEEGHLTVRKRIKDFIRRVPKYKKVTANTEESKSKSLHIQPDIILTQSHALSFIEYVPVAMAVMDLNGKILGANAVFKSTFPVPLEQSDFNAVELIAPEDVDRFYRSLEGLIQGPIESSGNFASFVKSVDLQSRSTKPLKANCSWVMRRDRTQEFIIITVKDSSERVATGFAHERRRMLRKNWDKFAHNLVDMQSSSNLCRSLGEKLETKRIFVRHVSHEIRTPLNVVMSGLDLLGQLAKDMTPEMKELLQDIKSACMVAVEILNDLLTYEKLDSGLLQLERSAYDIVELTRRVFEMFQIPARYSGVSLEMEVRIDSNRAIVDADSTKLSQVLRNLVSNSLKFTPKGGSVRVVVGLSEDKKKVRVEVRDTGAGMSRENRAKLFNEIVQFNAKELQNGQGSGMGLFISRRIIDMHGGSIGVDLDWEGPGSVFYLELPLSADLEANPRARKLSRFLNQGDVHTAVVSPPKVLPRLLIVDDAALCRRFHCRLLATSTSGLVEANDGQEAIDIVKCAMESGEYFDGILMDANMPFVDGLEASRTIRALGYRGKIFGITGNGFQCDIDDFVAAGADEVLVKPLSMDKYSYISHCCQ